MKVIAIDDEPIALDIICSFTDKVPYLQMEGAFTDAFKALDYLQRENVDLIFLDIKMPDISGIEFFNSLRKKPLLIFTTAYFEHAATGFEMDAVDYLLKPFSFARFLQACNKAYELFNLRNTAPATDHLFIKTGHEQVKINFVDILYIEAAGNYVSFVLRDKAILSRSTFAEAESLLPTDMFVRVHRSFIVAIDKIDKIERGQLTINKKSLPVSEAYSQNLSYISQKKRINRS